MDQYLFSVQKKYLKERGAEGTLRRRVSVVSPLCVSETQQVIKDSVRMYSGGFAG